MAAALEAERASLVVRPLAEPVPFRTVALAWRKGSHAAPALREMARQAMKRKAGARGLRAVMEDLMMEIMYEAPGNPALKDIRITAEMVQAQAEGGDAASRLLGV